ILDEPSAGLSPKIVLEVFDRLKAINRAGVTTVLVEQNVRAALAIADRAVILVEGRIAHEGEAAALADDPIIAELYLGARKREAPA
ncbi:MAG: ABC transporter ATP-binding protein, partial [Rhodobacteraceae bacterium]|nr:ABC transporter ATP-binding protein [Paracoccaceae bacterium]